MWRHFVCSKETERIDNEIGERDGALFPYYIHCDVTSLDIKLGKGRSLGFKKNIPILLRGWLKRGNKLHILFYSMFIFLVSRFLIYSAVTVLLLLPVRNFTGSFSVPRFFVAQNLAIDPCLHFHFIGSVTDSVTAQNFAQILSLVDLV